MTLKIGAHLYEVIYRKQEDDGIFDRNLQCIYINSDLRGTELFCTLIHEILHVINNEMEHTDIEYLSQAFTQVLVDNPELEIPKLINRDNELKI